MAQPFDLSLGLEDTRVLITGGCGLIGSVVVDAFLAAKSVVIVVDLPGTESNPGFQQKLHDHRDRLRFVPADIRDQDQLRKAFDVTIEEFGIVQCCVSLASLDLSSLKQTDSIINASPKDWQQVFDVNINGTFTVAQRWLTAINDAVAKNQKSLSPDKNLHNISLILMGSESGTFGVRGCAAYSAGKSAVQHGLLSSLAKDAPRIFSRARVNAVAPGAVDTARFREERERFGRTWEWEECEATVPLAKPVPAEHVARTTLFLASERWSGSTHGQVLSVDGGKMGSVVWREEEAREHGRKREWKEL